MNRYIKSTRALNLGAIKTSTKGEIMKLNIKAIRVCLEMYKYHLCHEDNYEHGDANYQAGVETLKNIIDLLPKLLEEKLPRTEMVRQIKEIKMREFNRKLETMPLETVLGDLLDEGFYPLEQECETYMCELIATQDIIEIKGI
jgi:hypothetical protein